MTTGATEPQAEPTEEEKLNVLRREVADLRKQEDKIKRGLFEKHNKHVCSECRHVDTISYPWDVNYTDGKLRRVLRLHIEDKVVGEVTSD